MLAKISQKIGCSFGATQPRITKLHAYHKEALGGKMVDFAGYDMPVLYSGPNGGNMKEHTHTRNSCGIFDVSHMGQTHFKGKGAAAFLEKMTVVDTQALHPGKASLSMLMNEQGGVVDDCIVTKVNEEHFYVVLNAGCKDKDMAHMNKYIGDYDCVLEYDSEDVRSLVAVQGPKAQHVVETVLDGINLTNMDFMESTRDLSFAGHPMIVSRCGYTGEDGFEISVRNDDIEAFMEALWKVKGSSGEQLALPVGLAARDSLRLEAGLCLYGNELNEVTSPIEAMLAWTISKRRKQELGFLGDDLIKKHLEEGVSKKRCGFIGDKVPIREGSLLYNADGKEVGVVCSGTKGPTIGKAIGMAYVDVPFNKFKTELVAKVRGKDLPVTVRKMPFVPSNYYKKP